MLHQFHTQLIGTLLAIVVAGMFGQVSAGSKQTVNALHAQIHAEIDNLRTGIFQLGLLSATMVESRQEVQP